MRVSLPTLPAMRCDSGCSDCCGPVLCTEKEYQAVKRHAHAKGVKPVAQGLTCPYFQEGSCQVCDVRPRICRLFGHADNLRCSKGYNVNVPRSVERAFMADYRPTRFLHEALGGDWQRVLLAK